MGFGFDGILGIGWDALDEGMSPPLDQARITVIFAFTAQFMKGIRKF